MEDIILVNKRGAPLYLGNQFKLVPGRNRFKKDVFEKLKLVKGYDTFIKTGSLLLLDTSKKAKVEIKEDEGPILPAEVVPVVVEDEVVTAPAAPMRKGKKHHILSVDET